MTSAEGPRTRKDAHRQSPLVAMQSAPTYAAQTWGPYFNAIYRAPRRVHWYAAWKLSTKGIDHAVALWRQREELRREYVTLHGSDPAIWPVRHPGRVVGGYGVCLACHWLHGAQHNEQVAAELARRHETSGGVDPEETCNDRL